MVDMSFLGMVQPMPPANYQQYNAYNSAFSPSTVHCSNTMMTEFFANYLLQDVFSVFDFKLPETIDMDYFRPVLFMQGFLSVFRTRTYGVVAQMCSFYGYNFYYRPTHVIINNALLKNNITYLEIGKKCEVIKLAYNYRGIYDIVMFFADLLALIAEGLGINILNSRLAYVFPAESKAKAESFKEMFDRIIEGNPTVVIDHKLMGETAWQPIFNHIKENFIAGDMIAIMKTIKQMFLTMVGIPNANTDKKERLVTAEVNSNNIETNSLTDVWLESLKADFKRANTLFGEELFGVERRYKNECIDDPANDIQMGQNNIRPDGSSSRSK